MKVRIFPRYLVLLTRVKTVSESKTMTVKQLEEEMDGLNHVDIYYAGHESLAACRAYGNLPIAVGEGKILLDLGARGSRPKVMERCSSHNVTTLFKVERIIQNAQLLGGSKGSGT